MKYYVDYIGEFCVHEEYSTLHEAMQRAMDFVEVGEDVCVSDSDKHGYDVIKYWYYK